MSLLLRNGWLLCLLLSPLCGCSMFTTGPMDVLWYQQTAPAKPNHHLFVFMRGLGGSHRSFEKEGLVDQVRSSGIPFDMAAPNADPGYYWDHTLVTRLKADVIDPARARGYSHIWLIGFSMGGLGSLLYIMQHPQEIEGVCLISPFLGGPEIFSDIRNAGGVRKWRPKSYIPELGWEKMLWSWLKTKIADNPAELIYLGYGSEDPYVEGQRLLATILPPERVFTIFGAHDYFTFKELWNIFLESRVYLSAPAPGISRP